LTVRGSAARLCYASAANLVSHSCPAVLAPNGSLNKFDGNNAVHNVYNGDFTQISAAASNDVYVVNWDKSLWERTGGGVWHHIN
jgi:hypothetical protein